jgi:hypothetical protein
LKKSSYYLIGMLLLLVLIPSCREEIIAPGNAAGNVNQPVRLQSGSTYTFIINAENLSTSFRDYPGVNSTHAQLILTLEDYSKGQATFYIFDYSNRLLYNKVIKDNFKTISASLSGRTPDIISVNFSNFTGKLKIQVFSN